MTTVTQDYSKLTDREIDALVAERVMNCKGTVVWLDQRRNPALQTQSPGRQSKRQ